MEGNFPAWFKVTTLAIMMRIRSLEKQVKATNTDSEKLNLLAKQNTLTATLSALAIGVDTEDTTLLMKLRSFK